MCVCLRRKKRSNCPMIKNAKNKQNETNQSQNEAKKRLSELSNENPNESANEMKNKNGRNDAFTLRFYDTSDGIL